MAAEPGPDSGHTSADEGPLYAQQARLQLKEGRIICLCVGEDQKPPGSQLPLHRPAGGSALTSCESMGPPPPAPATRPAL